MIQEILLKLLITLVINYNIKLKLMNNSIMNYLKVEKYFYKIKLYKLMQK